MKNKIVVTIVLFYFINCLFIYDSYVKERQESFLKNKYPNYYITSVKNNSAFAIVNPKTGTVLGEVTFYFWSSDKIESIGLTF